MHTYSGYENKVKSNLEMAVVNNGFQDVIQEVRIPVEEVVEVKNGKRRTVQRKLYPGYVMVKMIRTNEAWYLVRNTRGVTGFVGPGSDPIPLGEDEIDMINTVRQPTSIDIAIGDEVKVLSVSYTHLDVYKRQAFRSTAAKPIRKCPRPAARFPASSTRAWRSNIAGAWSGWKRICWASAWMCCTSSAAAARTKCSTASPRRPSAVRLSPARPRARPSATCWCRPWRWARFPAWISCCLLYTSSWGIQQVQQQGYRLSEFRMGCHCGTHLDAPAHVLAQGAAIEQAPLEQLNGLAALVDKERLESLPPGVRRVLIRDVQGDGIDRAQAEFLIRRGVCLVGVDALSVASGEAELPVHRRLLGAGCWILENLRLNGLEEGLYPLRCMPLLLKGLEAAPARAALGERQGRLK